MRERSSIRSDQRSPILAESCGRPFDHRLVIRTHQISRDKEERPNHEAAQARLFGPNSATNSKETCSGASDAVCCLVRSAASSANAREAISAIPALPRTALNCPQPHVFESRSPAFFALSVLSSPPKCRARFNSPGNCLSPASSHPFLSALLVSFLSFLLTTLSALSPSSN